MLSIVQGASNLPAFVVAKANQYARDHGRPEFVIYQGEWNVIARDVERDILPLCRMDGMHFLFVPLRDTGS